LYAEHGGNLHASASIHDRHDPLSCRTHCACSTDIYIAKIVQDGGLDINGFGQVLFSAKLGNGSAKTSSLILVSLSAPATLATNLFTHTMEVNLSNPIFNAGSDHDWLSRCTESTGSQMIRDNVLSSGIANGDYQTKIALPPWVLGTGNQGYVSVRKQNTYTVTVLAPKFWIMLLFGLFPLHFFRQRKRQI